MPRGAAVRERSVTKSTSKVSLCGAYSSAVVRPTSCTSCPDCSSPGAAALCQGGRSSETPPSIPELSPITEEKPSRLDVLSSRPETCPSSVHDASKVLMVLRPAGATAQRSELPTLLRRKVPCKWIADTGSTFDIVPFRECSNDVLSEKIKLKESVDMHTVNGVCTVDEGLRIAVPTLEKELEFLLMPNSPPIISVG